MTPGSTTADRTATESEALDSPPTWVVYNLIHKSSEPATMTPPVYWQVQNGPQHLREQAPILKEAGLKVRPQVIFLENHLPSSYYCI